MTSRMAEQPLQSEPVVKPRQPIDPGVRGAYMSDVPGPEFIPSDELDIFQRELRRYCRGEVEGRSFLIAGHRGAGKTTLVRHAVFQLEGDERALDRLLSRSWTSVRRDLCGDALDALRVRIQRLSEEGASALDDVVKGNGALQSGAETLRRLRCQVRRPLLVELHAPSIFPDGGDGDEQQLGMIAISQLIRSLYESVAERMTADYRECVLKKGLAGPSDEIAAQLRLLRHQPLTARELRPYWQHVTSFRHGVMFHNDSLPQRDQAYRELVALDVAGQAYKAVQQFDKSNDGEVRGATRALSPNGRAKSTPSTEEADNETPQPTSWADWAKPVLSLLAAGVLGSGVLTIPGVNTTMAFAVGASVLLIACLISLYYHFRLESDAQKLVSHPLPEGDYATLERMFRELLKHIKEAHLAPVFVIDELDKVSDLSTRMGPLVRSLKKLCAENAFFCFLTDRSYFERVNNIDRGTPYPVEYTYFTQQLCVLLKPDRGRAFIAKFVSDEDPELRSYFVAHRSRGLAIDIKRGLSRLTASEKALVGEDTETTKSVANELTISPSDLIDIVTQIAIEHELDRNLTNMEDRWRFLRDALYFPSDIRFRHQSIVDLEDEFEQYLRECTETDAVRANSREAVDDIIQRLGQLADEVHRAKHDDASIWWPLTHCRELVKLIDNASDALHSADRVQIRLGLDAVLHRIQDATHAAHGELRRELKRLRRRLNAIDPLPDELVTELRRVARGLCEQLCNPGALVRSIDCLIERTTKAGEHSREQGGGWLHRLASIREFASERPLMEKLSDGRFRWLSPEPDGGDVDATPAIPADPPRMDGGPKLLREVSDYVDRMAARNSALSQLEAAWPHVYGWNVVRLQVDALLEENVEALSPATLAEKREVIRLYESNLKDADHVLMFLIAVGRLVTRGDADGAAFGMAIDAVFDCLEVSSRTEVKDRRDELRSLLEHSGKFDIEGKRPLPYAHHRRLTSRGFGKWCEKTSELVRLAAANAPSPEEARATAWRLLERRMLDHAGGTDWSRTRLFPDGHRSADAEHYARLLIAYCQCRVLGVAPGTLVRWHFERISATEWTRLLVHALGMHARDADETTPAWLALAALHALGFAGRLGNNALESLDRLLTMSASKGACEFASQWGKIVKSKPRERAEGKALLTVHLEFPEAREGDRNGIGTWRPSQSHAVISIPLAEVEAILLQDGVERWLKRLSDFGPRFDCVVFEWSQEHNARIAHVKNVLEQSILAEREPEAEAIRWGFTHAVAGATGVPSFEAKLVVGNSFDDFVEALA